MTPLVVRVASVVAIAVLLGACALGTDGDGGDAPSDDLDEGESLGRIERLPGGTPVPENVRTLVGAGCTDGELEIITSEELIRAEMDCEQMLPQSIIERFIGQAVAVSYEGGRLLVANATAGTMELPVDDPKVYRTDATPGT